jgi:hypothetical protein
VRGPDAATVSASVPSEVVEASRPPAAVRGGGVRSRRTWGPPPRRALADPVRCGLLFRLASRRATWAPRRVVGLGCASPSRPRAWVAAGKHRRLAAPPARHAENPARHVATEGPVSLALAAKAASVRPSVGWRVRPAATVARASVAWRARATFADPWARRAVPGGRLGPAARRPAVPQVRHRGATRRRGRMAPRTA